MTTAGTFSAYHAPGPQEPFGITAGPDGALWFTNDGNDSIGRIDPATGAMTNYTGAGIVFPGDITVGPDGALWFTNNGNEANGQHDSIGRITTAGTVTSYTDPSISDPVGITSGPDGALWFTNQSNNSTGSIGRITTTGTITNYTNATISWPLGITVGPDGAMWFTNSANNSIGRITTTGTITNYTDPSISVPVGISSGPDGALWFTNNGHNANWVGRITTAGTVTHINAVIGSGITSGPDGALWLTDPADSLVARVTTSGIFTSYFDPTINRPYGIVAGPDGAMWFTNYGNNSIGRVTVPTTAFTVPDPPTSVSVNASNQSALVSYTAPANNGGLAITQYTASCVSSDGGAPGSATVPPITSMAVGGLTNGHTYQCTVTATNAIGTSLPSVASNTFVPLAVPDRPTNVVATASHASASVSFTAPANDGGSPITSYGVTCSSSDGGAPGNASGPSSPIVVTGLTNGHMYFCTVTATNVLGAGLPSGLSTGFVPGGVPDPPTNVVASRGNASASVSFTAPADNGGSPITGYTALCAASDGGAPSLASAAGTLIAVFGLTNGHAYQCTVTATNAIGTSLQSDASNAFVPATVPVAPGPVSAVRYGDTGAKVSVITPLNGGSAITGYLFTASPGGTSVSVSGSTTTATFSNLAPGAYRFRVRASNAVGGGAWSGWSNAVTVAASQHGQGGPPRSGYWMLGADGHVYAFGAGAYGNAPGPAVAIAPRRDGTGYWVTDALGDVSHFGAAGDHGDRPPLTAGELVSTISATPSGNGYWLFTNRGRAYGYGDAHFYGDMSGTPLNGPIIASVATPTGHGYYMVGSDGGVFSFGDARFHGSTGNLRLNKPVVGISPTPDNRGYWLVASDGGVFAFDASFRGSMGGTGLNKPVNGLVAFGNGYLMVASDGGVFDFSNRSFLGSLASNPPSAPIIGIAAFTI
jgi:streptogramin lyase